VTKIPFQVRVQRLAPETVAYIRHIGPYEGETTLFQRLFGQLFAWAEPRSLKGPEPRYLSLFQDNPNFTPAARQRLEVALVVPSGTPPGGEVGARTLDGGLCDSARVSRSRIMLRKWDAMVGEWLPGSGYQPDQRPAMDSYLNNPKRIRKAAITLRSAFPFDRCSPVLRWPGTCSCSCRPAPGGEDKLENERRLTVEKKSWHPFRSISARFAES